MQGIELREIDIGGQRLCVAIKPGPDDRPPLLLFNGIGANWELARPFLAAVTGRTAIIFDVPGIGGSPLPRFPYRPCTIARLGARLVRRLGYAQVDAGGVSWGGGPAQEFALNHPRLCRRLVLAATSPGVLMVPGALATILKLATPRRYYDKDYLRRQAGAIYGGAFGADADLVDQHIQAMAGIDGLGYALQLLAMSGWTSLPWLPFIGQPALVLMGRDDRIVPPVNGRIMAALMPRARLELIDDGHMFMISQPQRTAALIEGFLSQE